jgi:hypothetical protein
MPKIAKLKPLKKSFLKEYTALHNIRNRCRNPNCKDYKNYGGRGIKVCESWNDFSQFLNDIGPAPSKAHTIERIEVNGHYEPGNVRWATRAEQARNKRNSIYINYNGQRKMLTEWCAELDLRYSYIHRLLKINRPMSYDYVFSEALKPKPEVIKIKGRRERVKKTKEIKVKPAKRRYYHDLESVLIKYGLK